MSDGAGVIWQDRQVLLAGEAVVPALDRGLLYGDGVFETIRVYGGVPFRLGAHLERLAAGAEALQIALSHPAEALTVGLAEALRAAGLAEAYARITVTRGTGGAPSDLRGSASPAALIHVRALSALSPEHYASGVRACVSQVRRNETSPLSRIKSLNYLDSLLARSQAAACGCFEGLMLNTCGLLAEATAGNLFLVRRGRLCTPPISDGCLPGIARGVVMELCAVEERSLSLDDLRCADEAFVTNSLVEVLPLVEVDGSPVGTGTPGPAALVALAAYRHAVARECG